ncbi:hypothetical protein [Candidatus Parabeggiatoa sp. HSG14]|uniref:hypothetical protein n=1 Tax=Candidatus Parabeggiatoa sp. HSG14 TaxID=3055593 RepID=UPI0025A9254D|nr:hypothetical protein [Thiotrichales bacterium HSG14]
MKYFKFLFHVLVVWFISSFAVAGDTDVIPRNPVAHGVVSYINSMTIEVDASGSIVGIDGGSLEYEWYLLDIPDGCDVDKQSINKFKGTFTFSEECSNTSVGISLEVTNKAGLSHATNTVPIGGNNSGTVVVDKTTGYKPVGQDESCYITATVGTKSFKKDEHIKFNKEKEDSLPITFKTNCDSDNHEIWLYNDDNLDTPLYECIHGKKCEIDTGDYYATVVKIVDNVGKPLESSFGKQVSLTDFCATIREDNFFKILQDNKEGTQLNILSSCIDSIEVNNIKGYFDSPKDPDCQGYIPSEPESNNKTHLTVKLTNGLPPIACTYKLTTTIEDENGSSVSSETDVKLYPENSRGTTEKPIYVPTEKSIVSIINSNVNGTLQNGIEFDQKDNGEFIIEGLSGYITATVYLIEPLFSERDGCLGNGSELLVVKEDTYHNDTITSFRIPIRLLNRYAKLEFRVTSGNIIPPIEISHDHDEIVDLHFFTMSKDDGCIDWKPDTISQIEYSTLDTIRIYIYINIDKLLSDDACSVQDDKLVVNVDMTDGNNNLLEPFSLAGTNDVQPINTPFKTFNSSFMGRSDGILMLNLIDMLDGRPLSFYPDFRFTFTPFVENRYIAERYCSQPKSFGVDIRPLVKGH